MKSTNNSGKTIANAKDDFNFEFKDEIPFGKSAKRLSRYNIINI